METLKEKGIVRKAPTSSILDGLLSAKKAKIALEDEDASSSESVTSPSSPEASKPSSTARAKIAHKMEKDIPGDPCENNSIQDEVQQSGLSKSDLCLDATTTLANDAPLIESSHSLSAFNQTNDGSVPSNLLDPNGAYFTCNLCPKYFLNESNLKHHNSLYHSEKSFTCEICGKAFRFRSNLAEHRSVHTSLKPYVCKFCGKSSRLKGNLTKHILKHHKKEQSDFIGKDDIIIRKGKKSIKDPAAVDFLEKSMIVLTPENMNSAALQLFNLASKGPNANDKVGSNSRRRKAKGRNRPNHATLNNRLSGLSSDTTTSMSNTAEKIDSTPVFQQSPFNDRQMNSVHSGFSSLQSEDISRLETGFNVSKQQPTSGLSGAGASASRLFPNLPTTAAALATSLIQPNLQFLNFDHLFFALNKNGSANASRSPAPLNQMPIRNIEFLKQELCHHTADRTDPNKCLPCSSSKNATESENENDDQSKQILNEVISSNSANACQSGGSSSAMSGTKCEACGKHFRKSTNLAAHLATKHGSSLSIVEQNENMIFKDNRTASATKSDCLNNSIHFATSTPQLYDGVKRNQHNHKVQLLKTPFTSESPLSSKDKYCDTNGFENDLVCSKRDAENNVVSHLLTKDVHEMKEIFEEFKRHLCKTFPSSPTHLEPLLSSVETKMGRVENQVEISLATLYSLVQMQTEMNIAFFQFKSDIYEQLRSLQNLVKGSLPGSK